MLHDGRVLIAGGRGDTVTATAELYDPKTKQFVPTGNMQVARYKHTAGLLPDGRVLIAGGSDERDWNGALSSAEIYDPRTGRFTASSFAERQPLQAAGRCCAGRLRRSADCRRQQASGGLTIRAPVSSWSRRANSATTWHFMTETRLEDGTVLLAGGYPNNDRATARDVDLQAVERLSGCSTVRCEYRLHAAQCASLDSKRYTAKSSS